MTCEGILLLSFYEGLKQNGCPICRLLDNFGVWTTISFI